MTYTDEIINAVRKTGRQVTANASVLNSQKWNIDFYGGASMIFTLAAKPAYLTDVTFNGESIEYTYDSETGDLEVQVSSEGTLVASWASYYSEEQIKGVAISNSATVPGCAMKQLTLTLSGVKEVTADEITSVAIGVVDGDNTYWLPYGRFYVDKTDSGNVYNEDTNELTVIAYDSLIKTMTEIYVPEAQQDTVKNAWDYLNEIYANLLMSGVGLQLKGFSEFRTFLKSLTFKYGDYNGKTYRDFLNDVAGACCAIIQIEYDEEEETGEVYHYLSLCKLQNLVDTDNTKGLKLDDCSVLSSSSTRTVKKVILQGNEKNVEITGSSDSGDTLAISNNILIATAVANGSTSEIESNYTNSTYGLIDKEYSTLEATTWGLPWLTSGQFFKFETKDGTSKKTVVTSWKIELKDCGLTQTFSTSGMGTEQTDYNTGSSLAEVKSEINRLNTGLQLKVSKGDIISEINQTPDGVTINGSKINLNGTVTANESFKIDTNGTMSCVQGNIGGWNITPYCFEKDLDTKGDYKAYIGAQDDGEIDETPVYSIQERLSSSIYQYNYAVFGNGDFYSRCIRTGNEYPVSSGNATQMIEFYPNGDEPEFGGMYMVNAGQHPVLIPSSNKKGYLGTTSGSQQFGEMRWYGIYLATSPNVSSDRKVKQEIQTLLSENNKKFVMGLKPCSYKLTYGDNGRIHMGFIAQEVAESANKTVGDLSVFEAVKVNEDGTTSYYAPNVPDEDLSWGLKYEELIAPLTAVVQMQQKQIDDLTERLEKIERRLVNAENN